MEDQYHGFMERLNIVLERLRTSDIEFHKISDLYSSTIMLMSAVRGGVLSPQDHETLQILERVERQSFDLLKN